MGGRAGGGASGGMGKGSRGGGDASMRHLSSAAQKSLKAAEESIRRNSVEYGVVMDEQGNIIWKGTNNKEGSVHIGVPGANRIVTHNHPIQGRNKGRDRADDGGSFSKQDFAYARWANVKEMRAVTGKYSFSIKRPDKGWNSEASDKGTYRRAKARVDRQIKKYYEATKGNWKQAGHRVGATYWHMVNKEFAKAAGYTYTKTKVN